MYCVRPAKPRRAAAYAQETVDFVYTHGEAIHSASPGAFVLERHSPAHRAPAQHSIRRVEPSPARDLAIYFTYGAEGLAEATAEQVVERLLEVLPEKRYAHFYANDAWRLLYAARLREQGQPLPGWLTEDTDGTG